MYPAMQHQGFILRGKKGKEGMGKGEEGAWTRKCEEGEGELGGWEGRGGGGREEKERGGGRIQLHDHLIISYTLTHHTHTVLCRVC